ncbi:MAG: CHAT domain-containing protein [Nannocystis sp.]|nr:CHAT domain-containing protein [Nannocystis sp.]
MPNEHRLRDELATLSALTQRLPHADVLCFYAHGDHPEVGKRESPYIELADGRLHMHGPQAMDWRGLERVEFWACKTGVDVPFDPRSSLAAELFGVDGQALYAGARSAIGTLLSVNDFITAQISHAYRRELVRGQRADRALCTAMRRWRDRELEPFVAQLLAEGPPAEREALARIYRSPLVWAGYRFVGVCEHRGEVVRRPMPGDLNSEEQQRLGALLDELDAPGRSMTEWIEDEIERLHAASDPAPSPSDGLALARLYAARLLDAHETNLLRGLACAHTVPGVDSERLCALLWLRWATRGTFDWEMARARGPLSFRRAGLARAGLALASLPADGAPELRALLAVLTAIMGMSEETCWERTAASSVTAAAARVPALLAEMTSAVPGVEALEEAAVWCWLLSTAPAAADALARLLLETLGPALREIGIEPRTCAATSLLVATSTALAHALSVPPPLRYPELEWLTEPFAVSMTLAELRRQPRPGASGKQMLRELSAALTHVETHLWDHPQGNGTHLWKTTGCAGPNYRELAGSYVAGIVDQANSEHFVSVVAAQAQFFADLRRPVLHRLANLCACASAERRAGAWQQWRMARGAIAAIQQLEDVTMFPPRLTVDGEDIETTAARLDPYHLDAVTVAGSFQPTDDASFYELAQLAPRPLRSGCPLAWAVVRGAAARTGELGAMWRALNDAGVAPWGLLQPPLDFEHNQRAFDSIAPGHARLCALIDVKRRVVLGAIWHDGVQLHRRLVAGEPGSAFVALELVRGLHVDRGEALQRVRRCLDPLVRRCLGDACGRELELEIFAPGGLRGVPWAGLTFDGSVLSFGFAGISLTPNLAWRSDRVRRQLCCWFEPQADGAAPFGAQVIAGLRELAPPEQVFASPFRGGRDIPEANALEEAVAAGRSLRVYGDGFGDGWAGRDGGLLLRGQRMLVDRNISELCFTPGADVELWAATASLYDHQRGLFNADDRLPGLVEGFFLAGAAGVLDLAWPVPDVVRALVCEHYGLRRRTQDVAGAHALVAALRWTAHVLADVAGAPADPTALLDRLDAARAQAARRLGLRAAALRPFAACASAVPDGATLARELADPSHLAAFRWWGAGVPLTS